MDLAIDIKKLNFTYPRPDGKKELKALSNINLKVKKNETFGLIGPNGAGKSTLCFAIAGLIPNQMQSTLAAGTRFVSGTIKILDNPAVDLSKNQQFSNYSEQFQPHQEVGLVTQNPESQFLSASMKEEIKIGLKFRGLTTNQINARVAESLKMVGLSDLYKESDSIHPTELSGGQKQRLIIASFLAMRPKILILDQTTSDLDSKGKMEVLKTIEKLKKSVDMTTIIVDNDLQTLSRFADRVAVMANGKIKSVGTTQKILNLMKSQQILETSTVLPIKPGTKDVIMISHLSFEYEDGTVALDDVSIKIKEGELVALVGPNGSGKTTLGRIISGFEKRFGGRAVVCDLNLSSNSERKSVSRRLGYVFQNPNYQLLYRSVYDELLYSSSFRGLEAQNNIKIMLKKIKMEDKSNEDPYFLPEGNKKMLAIATVLIRKPDIIIFDEPTTGQDSGESLRTIKLIQKLHEEGQTVILITHNMNIVKTLCPRTIALDQGSIKYDGDTKILLSDKKMLKTLSIT